MTRAEYLQTIRDKTAPCVAARRNGTTRATSETKWIRNAATTFSEHHNVNAPHIAVETGSASILEWCEHLARARSNA
ncbi:MAG: hypothetical protein HC933_06390 [Pleurocapsa sp. SU_196_0]|nr:hypothetical protein [Pleurocapsa sp. SU_196_0]